MGGKRFAWTFNPYALWDSSQWPFSKDKCEIMKAGILNIDYSRNVMAEVRKRITEVTGNTDDILWVGETGWSSPAPSAMVWINRYCPTYFSDDMLLNFYKMILSWDLSLPGVKGIDHLFYFTIRDSSNHGAEEGFGLVKNCQATSCKARGTGPTPAPPAPPVPPTPGSTCKALGC